MESFKSIVEIIIIIILICVMGYLAKRILDDLIVYNDDKTTDESTDNDDKYTN